MAEPKKPPADLVADRVVATARVFTAPCQEVFATFSDPARLAQWWGPRGFRNSIGEFDFRPGGTWRLTMAAPDGNRYPNHWIFREIVAPARLVLEHVDAIHSFEREIRLAAHGAGTRLNWRMTFATVAECTRVRALVTVANEESLDRLDHHLSTHQS